MVMGYTAVMVKAFPNLHNKDFIVILYLSSVHANLSYFAIGLGIISANNKGKFVQK